MTSASCVMNAEHLPPKNTAPLAGRFWWVIGTGEHAGDRHHSISPDKPVFADQTENLHVVERLETRIDAKTLLYRFTAGRSEHLGTNPDRRGNDLARNHPARFDKKYACHEGGNYALGDVPAALRHQEAEEASEAQAVVVRRRAR